MGLGEASAESEPGPVFESGGQMIDAILTNTLLPQLSREFLERISQGLATREVVISVKDGDFGCSFA